jgi:hypothetical protein
MGAYASRCWCFGRQIPLFTLWTSRGTQQLLLIVTIAVRCSEADGRPAMELEHRSRFSQCLLLEAEREGFNARLMALPIKQ